MSNAITILQDLLNLQEIEPNHYVGQSHNPGWFRVYGGQVIAQAILAASKTVAQNHCHSAHGYFMRPGDPDKPITYKIDPIRDGRSFQTRMVYASQENEKGNQKEQETIFAMGASFHKQEDGFDHQDEMGDVPLPDDLPSMKDLIATYKDQIPKEVTTYFGKERPFEFRPLNIKRYIAPQPGPALQAFWMKTVSPLQTPNENEQIAIQQAALGYASDFTLLDTALIPHGKLLFNPNIMMASLDHAIWFHRPFQINEWLLYKQTSSNAFGARGLCQGQFFDQSGTLIASTTQEGLTRPKTKKPSA